MSSQKSFVACLGMMVVLLMASSSARQIEFGAHPEKYQAGQPKQLTENFDQHCTVFYAANEKGVFQMS